MGTKILLADDMLRLEDENFLMLLLRDATRRARVVKGAKLPISRASAISVFIDMVACRKSTRVIEILNLLNLDLCP